MRNMEGDWEKGVYRVKIVREVTWEARERERSQHGRAGR